MKVAVEPLTPERFSAFGEVLEPPSGAGRQYFERSLANLRPQARPSLSIARRNDVATLPLQARIMERHQFSSQSFLPVEVGRWLVLVAPHAADGGPDMTAARAFLARPDQGVTIGADVWHHPLTVFDRPAVFAIAMWLCHGPGDEEFRDLAEPVAITA